MNAFFSLKSCFFYTVLLMCVYTTDLNGQLDSVLSRMDLNIKFSLNHNYVHKIPGNSYRARLHRTTKGTGFKIGVFPEYLINNLRVGIGINYSRQNYFREQYSPPELVFNRRELSRVYDINISSFELSAGLSYEVLKTFRFFGQIEKEQLIEGTYKIDLFQFGEFTGVERDDGNFDPIFGNSVYSCTYGLGIAPFEIHKRDIEIQFWRKYNLSRRFVGAPLFDNRIIQNGISIKFEIL